VEPLRHRAAAAAAATNGFAAAFTAARVRHCMTAATAKRSNVSMLPINGVAALPAAGYANCIRRARRPVAVSAAGGAGDQLSADEEAAYEEFKQKRSESMAVSVLQADGFRVCLLCLVVLA